MSDVHSRVEEVFGVLEKSSAKYEAKSGRSVTQLEHALQCGQLALDAGDSELTVVAALLHDIGHYLPHVQAVELIDDNAPGSRRSHDAVGAVYLHTLGFPAAIGEIVGAHVDAKRYLTATDSTYYDQLSLGSKNSLRLQGGPFNSKQIADFESLPYYREAVKVRVYDDKAKVVDLETYSLDSFRPFVQRLLESSA